MVQTKDRLTWQDFLELFPGDGDITYEFIDGKAVAKMSPKKFHSQLTRGLLYLIDEWCEGKGKVYPELAVKLSKKRKRLDTSTRFIISCCRTFFWRLGRRFCLFCTARFSHRNYFS